MGLPSLAVLLDADRMSSNDLFQPFEATLRDGRTVTIRAIREHDADRLQAAIRSLSPDSRYMRFFSPIRELPPQLLNRATHPDGVRELQLVAVVPAEGGDQIVAGARYAATDVEGDCEFAVAVVDAWHGVGLARRMLESLMQAARVRGFRRMEGYILATNVPMLGLAERLGFTAVRSPEGPSVRLLRCDLVPPA
jgi:RimJ/RimL family protein N-acetyltransferase